MPMRKYHPSLVELITHQFDLSDAAAAEGEHGNALACEHLGRARALMKGLDVLSIDNSPLYTRLYETETRVIGAVQSMDAKGIRGRIHGALLRLGGMATLDALADEVSKRIHFAEEARVQMMHMLGKDLLISWPDHHAPYEILEELGRMRKEGLVRSVLPMAFWRGRLWSAVPGREIEERKR